MLDRSIPFFNLILRCDEVCRQEVLLPPGFSFTPYRRGDEWAWAALEYAAGDFPSAEEAEAYFAAVYLREEALLRQQARFLLREDGAVVGSCIAWQDRRGEEEAASLHWLIVDEWYQGLGLGRALCGEVMNLFAAQGRTPVYLHTQPWSWKAIFLYLSLGFRLQRTDTFAGYDNEYSQAMAALRPVIGEAGLRRLEAAADP